MPGEVECRRPRKTGESRWTPVRCLTFEPVVLRPPRRRLSAFALPVRQCGRVHRIPTSTFVTVAKRPSSESGTARIEHAFPKNGIRISDAAHHNLHQIEIVREIRP